MIKRLIKLQYNLFSVVIVIVSVLGNTSLLGQESASGFTQPSLVKALRIEPGSQTVSYPIWVDQTDYLSITISSLVKNLTIKLVAPSGVILMYGQPVSGQFECFLNPDPTLLQDTVGVNYHMDLTNPMKGLWNLQIQISTIASTLISIPVHLAFNSQVGLVLFGGGDGPIGRPVSYSLAVMDGITKVNGLQIIASVYRLDDPFVPPMPITFADDGLGADYLAGDAIYSTFITPTQPGSYMLQVEVSGDASTGHFQRSTASGFKVVPKNASITGNFAVKPRVGVPK